MGDSVGAAAELEAGAAELDEEDPPLPPQPVRISAPLASAAADRRAVRVSVMEKD